MPRRQQPPDPTRGPAAAFACQLQELRRSVGEPSYREMATRVHITHTSLSRAAKGDRFPTWDVTKAYVLACDAEPTEWEPRWKAAAALVQHETEAVEAAQADTHNATQLELAQRASDHAAPAETSASDQLRVRLVPAHSAGRSTRIVIGTSRRGPGAHRARTPRERADAAARPITLTKTRLMFYLWVLLILTATAAAFLIIQF